MSISLYSYRVDQRSNDITGPTRLFKETSALRDKTNKTPHPQRFTKTPSSLQSKALSKAQLILSPNRISPVKNLKTPSPNPLVIRRANQLSTSPSPGQVQVNEAHEEIYSELQGEDIEVEYAGPTAIGWYLFTWLHAGN